MFRKCGQAVVLWSAIAGGAGILQQAIAAQPPDVRTEGEAAVPKTLIEVELLTPQLTDAVVSQRWGKVFEKLELPVRVRPPILDDQPVITESIRGTYRLVKIVGQIDDNGAVVFPARKYTLEDTGPLAEWIDEVKAYGAQGAPEGKPLWGLTEAQFKAVFGRLSAAVPEGVEGFELLAALERIGLPADLRLRFRTSATEFLKDHPPAAAVSLPVEGLSCGTALAALLADAGLGFRPLRNPAEKVELVVQPLAELSDPWPVGWPPADNANRLQLAPELFKMVSAGFEEVSLEDVLNAATRATGVPVLADHFACRAKGIDIATFPVNYPQQTTAWTLLLNTVVRQARLTKEIKLDENGKVFVYVYPFQPRPLKPRSAP